MKFQIFAKIELKDKNGKVVKTINRKCHSYIAQMMYLLKWCMNYDRSVNVYKSNALASDHTYGIQVGTGTNAVTITDTALQTLIVHGNEALKLAYGAMSISEVAIVGSTAKFTLARTYTNNSGADITVNEVGLRCMDTYDSTKYLLERTLLTFTIANGASGTVTYTLSVTV